MQIAKIEVSIRETFSFDQDDTRPLFTICADLDSEDDIDTAIEILYQKCKAKVEAYIDEALMQNDQPPKFYAGDRYDIWVSNRLKLVVILRAGSEEQGPMPLHGSDEQGNQIHLWSCAYKEWPDFDLEAKCEQLKKKQSNHSDSLILDADEYPWIPLIIDTEAYPWLKYSTDFSIQTLIDGRFLAYESAIKTQK